MIITEDQLKRIIDDRVRVQLEEQRNAKISRGWLQLRSDIADYCKSVSHCESDPVYSKVQNAIYLPIKYALKLGRIDEVRDDQIDRARQIFNVIKLIRSETAVNMRIR
ncbi:hypothetical protein OFW50_03615 [Lacticaseibacillus chiayiensis]|uniref:Uncharacterized protein n=1 Tax=Lacticaseibacillus chiayiensis TaxID=2100821 RepID=A0ABY6H729_9LACO|nr:hypothetical protein [Lacticaseibacillus chiayiensis]UYN57175.1 hypothetical protein OFW50_03615 [Lacticaseibacillus chiayiensis]